MYEQDATIIYFNIRKKKRPKESIMRAVKDNYLKRKNKLYRFRILLSHFAINTLICNRI